MDAEITLLLEKILHLEAQIQRMLLVVRKQNTGLPEMQLVIALKDFKIAINTWLRTTGAADLLDETHQQIDMKG